MSQFLTLIGEATARTIDTLTLIETHKKMNHKINELSAKNPTLYIQNVGIETIIVKEPRFKRVIVVASITFSGEMRNIFKFDTENPETFTQFINL